MYLTPDKSEAQVADEARRILADLTPIARLHRHPAVPPELTDAARSALAQSGWFGLHLAEADGGSGMSEVEFALFFREAGRQCASVDILAQSLSVLIAASHPELRGALVGGERTVALLVGGMEGGARVLGPADAQWILDVTPDHARLLELISAAPQTLPSLDPAVSMQRIDLAAAKALIEMPGAALWCKGQLGTAAMLVGIAEAALALLVDYAKVRQTFGRAIGSYQAVRHPCADIAMRVEAARCQLWFAAAALKEARRDTHGHLDAAKHLANEAAAFATDLNIQLHGGIGVTDEHDAHIYMKHALLLRKLFGAKRALLSQLLHAQLET